MKKIFALVLAVVLIIGLVGCGTTTPPATQTEAPAQEQPAQENEPATQPEPANETFKIGMSQCNNAEPWREAMNAQVTAAIKNYPELELVNITDAAADNSKQVADVETWIEQGIDLLIISPNEAAPLTAVVAQAYDAGIPVIVLDRRVEGDKFTSFIGGDNVKIGKAAGAYVAKNFPDGAKIVELKGLEGATPQEERARGFREGMGEDAKYEFVFSQNCDWLRDKAVTLMETALQANKKIDVVYGHNDPAAIGAYISAKNVGREKEMIFIGIDALPHEGIQAVLDGELTVTYVYPTGGEQAAEAAYRLLVKGETLEKEVILDTLEITIDNAAEMQAKFGG